LERTFGQPPAVYRDERTGVITVTVYPQGLPAPEGVLRSGLARELGRLRRLELGQARVTLKPLRRENWAHSWKRHFRPLEIGHRLLIKPSWSRRRARAGQRVIILDPGLSFGTGHHPTTLFCLQQLARGRRQGTRQSLLDIGSGSGILAIAAAKLGYSPVEAIDCDPEAVRVGLRNIKRNRVRLRLWRGDLTRMPLVSRRRYDVVCANLTCDLLVGEAEKIRNRLKPGGRLVVAGILRREFAGVRKKLQRINLTLRQICVQKEWKSGQFALKRDRSAA
jgi:ribosomal protein L11 methyltransferase